MPPAKPQVSSGAPRDCYKPLSLADFSKIPKESHFLTDCLAKKPEEILGAHQYLNYVDGIYSLM